MKNFVFFFLIIAFSSNAQLPIIGVPFTVLNPPESLANEKITLCNIYRYATRNDEFTDSALYQRNEYDSLGRVTRMHAPEWVTSFFYQEDKLVQIIQQEEKGKHKVIYKFQYDSAERLHQQKVFDSESRDSTIYYFFYRGQQLLRVNRKKDGITSLFREYNYEGERMSSVEEWKEGKRIYQQHFTYEEGKSKTAWLQQKKKRIKYYLEEYDENGNLARTTTYAYYDSKGRVHPLPVASVITYRFGTNGLLAESEFTGNSMTTVTTRSGASSHQTHVSTDNFGWVDVYRYYRPYQ